jgi:hypothetical protein
MAIFKCVGYFYFHIPEGICFAGAKYNHVKEKEKKKTNSETDSFRNMKVKI